VQYGDREQGFSLMCTRKGRLEQTVAVGRDWEPNYPGNFHVVEGKPWGSVKFSLMPAFAGLADEVLDKTTMAALSGLPHIASGGRASDFTVAARHGLRELIGRDFNATRFLVRLAVMWVGAMLAEQQRDELVAANASGMREPVYVNTMPEINTMIVEATQARTNVVFADLGHEYVAASKIVEVLMLAAADNHGFRRGSRGTLPSVLRLWPRIPNAQVHVYGMPAASINPGTMYAADIWNAAALYVRQNGLQEQWAEALEVVAVFALRPTGETV
jgi:hypothetical protein